jgi:hypothetical protein
VVVVGSWSYPDIWLEVLKKTTKNLRVAGQAVEIRTEYLPIMSLQRYRYISPFGFIHIKYRSSVLPEVSHVYDSKILRSRVCKHIELYNFQNFGFELRQLENDVNNI